jgi:HEAT repeat protein
MKAYQAATETTKSGDAAPVIALLDAADSSARFHAISTIRRRKFIEAAPALLSLLENEHEEELREAIVGTLADLAVPATAETFRKLLRDPSSTVRRLALRGLAALNDPAAASASKTIYQSGDRSSKFEALDALSAVDNPSVSDVIRQLYDSERSWLWKRRLRVIGASAKTSKRPE